MTGTVKKKLAVSPLTGDVFFGKVDKKGDFFVGKKENLTSDFLCCVIDKARIHEGNFVIQGANKKWEVTVKEIPNES